MFYTGVLWWDLRVARGEVDAAEARGADRGIIANLRATLDQCERDRDDDSARAVGTYAARLGAAGAYTVETPADVVVQEGLDAAKTVKSAAAQTESVAFVALVLLAIIALRR